MTCIVGLKHYDGYVYMGADSCGSNDGDQVTRVDAKVFHNGDFLIGCTTSFRMIQILMFSTKFEKLNTTNEKEIFEYMCTKFVDTIRESFKSKGFLQEDEFKCDLGGTFLVGYKYKLYKVHSDFHVEELDVNYNACGSGESFAKGVLHSLNEEIISPKVKIKKALEASEYFSAGVRGPFKILKTKKYDW